MNFADAKVLDIRSLVHTDLVLAINVALAMFAWIIFGFLTR